MTPIAQTFIENLRTSLKECPAIGANFFNSFAFTTTGQNFCHPRMHGLIVKVAWGLPDVAALDIDVRLNRGNKLKFQPDTVALDCSQRPLLIADFESPNSSDARIPEKDVKTFLAWARATECRAPYFIITSLPSMATPWELRWTAKDKWNGRNLRGRKPLILN